MSFSKISYVVTYLVFFVHSTYSVIRGQTVSWVTLYLLLMNIVIAAVLPNDIVETSRM